MGIFGEKEGIDYDINIFNTKPLAKDYDYGASITFSEKDDFYIIKKYGNKKAYYINGIEVCKKCFKKRTGGC